MANVSLPTGLTVWPSARRVQLCVRAAFPAIVVCVRALSFEFQTQDGGGGSSSTTAMRDASNSTHPGLLAAAAVRRTVAHRPRDSRWLPAACSCAKLAPGSSVIASRCSLVARPPPAW